MKSSSKNGTNRCKSQGRTSPERNVYKKEPEQTKNNIYKQEKKLIRFVKRKRSNG